MSLYFSCLLAVSSSLHSSGDLSPHQSSRLVFGANRWEEGSNGFLTTEFVKQKLDDVLNGRNVDPSPPPPIDLICNHSSKVNDFMFVSCSMFSLYSRPRRSSPSMNHACAISYRVLDETLCLAWWLLHTRTSLCTRIPLFSRYIILTRQMSSSSGRSPLDIGRDICWCPESHSARATLPSRRSSRTRKVPR